MAMSQTLVENDSKSIEGVKEEDGTDIEVNKLQCTTLKLTPVEEVDETQFSLKVEATENNATSTTSEDSIDDSLISKVALDKVDFIRVCRFFKKYFF